MVTVSSSLGEKRSSRKINRESIIRSINALASLGYYFDILNKSRHDLPVHIRVDWRLDIYPVNKRYHDVISNSRGSYNESLEDFVTHYLKTSRVSIK